MYKNQTQNQGQQQNQEKHFSDDKLIVSFSLPYQYIKKPLNTYHESLILSNWRVDDTNNGNHNSNLNSNNNIPAENNLIFDNLLALRNIIKQINESYATYGIITILNEFKLSYNKIIISIIGTNQFKNEINDIKLNILQNFSQISKSIIKINKFNNQYCFVNDSISNIVSNELKLDLLNFITNVSNFNKCSIFIEETNSNDNENNSIITYEISIIGFKDQVKVTENKINLFIDDMNPQIFSDYLELSSISILPLICGTNLSTLRRIIQQTNCNIYLPNLLPELYYNNSLNVELNNPKIFLTGLRCHVLLAKKWLSDLILNYTSNPFIKQVTILPVKREYLILDQILSNNGEFFDNLMFQSSCYLSLPSLGSKFSNTSTIMANLNSPSNPNSNSNVNQLSNPSSASSNTSPSSPISNNFDSLSSINTSTSSLNINLNQKNNNHNINNTNNNNKLIMANKNSIVGDILTIQGNSTEEIENLLNELTNKVSTYYSEKIEFVLNNNDHIVDINKLLNFNDSLVFNSNCTITCLKVDNKYIFQILGNSDNIKIATNYLNQFSSFINEQFKSTFVQYQIELPNKEKDFIAGKKNGKIIKIINMSSVSIKLLPFTESNFIVDISGNDLLDSILGLGLFEDELPTIYNFNVPESFHRQIIGVGGQTIQIIMRKFNVFVKFSNSFELNDKNLDNNNNNNNNNNNSNNNNMTMNNNSNQNNLQSTNFQQSFIRKNNVIIKCPSKNKSEIPLAKKELEKLVDKVKRNNYSCLIVKLLLSDWKLLTSTEFNLLFNTNRKKPTNFITELEKKTNTFINYPPLDSINNNQDFIVLEIYGIENNSKMCCLELSKLLPYIYSFKISNDNEDKLKLIKLNEILKSNNNNKNKNEQFSLLQLNFLNNIVIPLKLLYDIEVDIKTDDSNLINLHYFPNSFGVSMNVNNPERFNEEIQRNLTKSVPFFQIINGMHKFLNDWSMNLISEDILNTEIYTEDLGYKHQNYW